MDNESLQQWVEAISLQYFNRPFKHKATFNRRLRTTGGRYFLDNHNIEISRLQYDTFGREEVESIIKHELCHYHLHLQNRGFRHQDPEFKQLLQEVGGTRYCKAVPQARRVEPYRYRLVCRQCQTEYLRKRRMNFSKYVCGRCKGKLTVHTLPRQENRPKE